MQTPNMMEVPTFAGPEDGADPNCFIHIPCIFCHSHCGNHGNPSQISNGVLYVLGGIVTGVLVSVVAPVTLLPVPVSEDLGGNPGSK